MKRLLFTFLLLLGVLSAWAQTRLISGKITDEEGETLPGVNVLIKGTSTGTVSDIDGNYSFQIPENDPDLILEFSFVGLATQDIKVGDQLVINVEMGADAKQLEDVVIVGYTKVDKSTSVPVIDNVKDIVTPNVSQTLTGKSSGVAIQASTGQPGAKTNVRIRGVGSINGATNPLYVIDGVIIDSDEVITGNQQSERDPLANINPSDIADIRILKDAAATALYGARASNGVIVITTKQGEAGETTFSANLAAGVSRKYDGKFELMNAAQYIDYFGLNAADYNGIDTDWQDLAFRTGHTLDFQISAKGGNEKTKFFTSIGYFDQEGILIGSDFKRYSGRLNVDNQATDKLKLSFSIDVAKSFQNDASSGGLFSSPLLGSYFQAPVNSPYDANGNLYTRLPATPVTPITANFVYDTPLNKRLTESLWGGISGKLEYDIWNGISFRSTNSYRLEIARLTQYFEPTTSDGFDPNAAGSINETNSQNGVFTTTNLLNYETAIGKGNFTALLGTEFQDADIYFSTVGGSGLPIPLDVLQATTQQFTADGRGDSYKFFSILSQVTYNYDGRYYLSGSFRRDGSSRFGSDNRYGNFFSVGASWIIDNEEFFSKEVISQLKLRGSFGTTGNANGISNFASRGLYRYGVYNGQPASTHFQIANPDLTWEVKEKANVGFDIGFKSRVKMTVDFYHEKSRDLLLQVPLAGENGFVTVTKNAGSLVNKGIELTITANNIEKENFTWETDFNISLNDNEVTSLDGIAPIRTGFNTIEEGQSIYTFYMPEWLGANPANGDPAWYVNEQTPITSSEVNNSNSLFFAPNGRVATTNYSEAERIYAGSPLPKFTGGMTNKFNFYGVDFSFLLTFQTGNKIYNRTRTFNDADGTRFFNQVVSAREDRWTNPGQTAFRPRFGSRGGTSTSTRYLEDGDFLSLRNITLGYTLPDQWIGSLGLSKVRVYVSGQNLWILTNYTGYTPTTVDFDGYNSFEYPEGIVITGGLNVNF